MSDTHTQEQAQGKTRKADPAPEAPATKRVIIQRPYGETGTHVFVGFNDFERQIAFDQPVVLPIAVVNHLRSLRQVEHRPDDSGKVIATYANQFSVVDA